MFNAITAFKGGKGCALTEKGIISLRLKHFKPVRRQEVLGVLSGGYVATYSLGEFAGLFDLPPPSGKHRNYRWGRLPDGNLAFFPLRRKSLLGE